MSNSSPTLPTRVKFSHRLILRRLRFSALAAMLLAIALALGACEHQNKSAAPPGRVDLSAFPIEGPIAAILAREGSPSAGGNVTAFRDSSAYLVTRLRSEILRPATRGAACGELYARWRRNPRNMFFLSLAVRMRSSIGRPDELAEMLARLAENENDAIPGLYAAGLRDWRTPAGTAQLKEAWHLAESDSGPARIVLGLHAATSISFRRDHEEALSILLEIRRDALPQGGPALAGLVWHGIGKTLRRLGRNAEAMHALKHAAEFFEAQDLERPALVARFELAVILAGERDLRVAISVLEGLAEKAGAGSWRHVRAMALNRLAYIFQSLDETGTALRINQELVRDIVAAGDSITAPRAYLNLADSWLNLGRLDSARVALDEAERWVRAKPDSDNTWAVYADNSFYWLLRGDYEKADSLSRLAQLSDPGTRRPEEEMIQLFHIARLGRELGRPELSYLVLDKLEALKDSVQSVLPGIDHRFDADLEMARFRMETGEFDLAERSLKLASERLRAQPGAGKAARYWDTHATLAQLRGGSAGALAAFDSSLAWAGKSGRPNLISRQRLALGRMLLEQGEIDRADSLFHELASHLDADLSYRSRQLQSLMLAKVAAARGDLRESIALCTGALDKAGANMARDLAVDFRLELARASAAVGEPRHALDALREALGFLSEGQFAARSPELRLIAGEEIRELYLAWIGLLMDHPSLRRASDPARETLELRQDLLDMVWGRQPIGDLQPPRGLSVAYLLDEERSYLWVLDGYDISLHTLPGRAVLLTEILALRRSIELPGRALAKGPARRLGDMLLAPLSGRWRSGETLQILPDGELHGLPWTLLPWGEGRILDHAPVLETFGRPDGEQVAEEATGSLLAVGFNGDGKDGLPRLLDAEREAREVAVVWRGSRRVLTGAEARGDLLQASVTRGQDCIHLAVHSRVHRGLADQAYLSLATADLGHPPLSCREISRLELDTKLVFLSACESSRGPLQGGRAILDLARAFVEAGAGSVIASSFQVDDRASRELALAFYRHWADLPDLAEALRLAQIDLRQAHPDSPYYWAHFQLLRRTR